MTRVERIDCDNATEFVEAISPRGDHFRESPNPSPWIFRGQPSDSMHLVASALRDDKRREVHEIAQTLEIFGEHFETNLAHAIAELTILRMLEEELDRQGLEVPTITTGPRYVSQLLESFHDSYKKDSKSEKAMAWPCPELAGIMSLAQHYRLPTRLLDWTRSAFIAAYFALGLDNIADKKCGRASVWALNTTGIGECLTFKGGAPNLSVITVPRRINPHLHAQDGLFTLFAGGQPQLRGQAVRRFAIDEVIENTNDRAGIEPDHRYLLHFTVPREQIGIVLWLLAREGITASKLFPGHAGAVRAVRERMLAKRP